MHSQQRAERKAKTDRESTCAAKRYSSQPMLRLMGQKASCKSTKTVRKPPNEVIANYRQVFWQLRTRDAKAGANRQVGLRHTPSSLPFCLAARVSRVGEELALDLLVWRCGTAELASRGLHRQVPRRPHQQSDVHKSSRRRCWPSQVPATQMPVRD